MTSVPNVETELHSSSIMSKSFMPRPCSDGTFIHPNSIHKHYWGKIFSEETASLKNTA